MNKNLLITAIILLTGFLAKAQTDLYQFSHTTAAYNNVPSSQKKNPAAFPTSLDEFVLPLPFDFMVYNETFNSVRVTTTGLIYFSNSSSAKIKAIITLGAELEDFDASSGIYTATVGTAGNRIFIIEHREMGIYFGNAGDFINFQVWLYEGSNNVEMRYGPRTDFDLMSYDSEEGPSVGIVDVDTSTFKPDTSYYLTGDPTAPTLVVTAPDASDVFFVDGHIAANTVYRFTRKSGGAASVKGVSVAGQGFTVFPNPCAGGKVSVHFDSPLLQEANLILTDINGREISCQTVPADCTLAEINTDGLVPGVYMLKAAGDGAWQVWQKVIIN